MKRRNFLAGLTTGAGAALSGCVAGDGGTGESDGGGGTSGGGEGTGSEGGTPAGTDADGSTTAPGTTDGSGTTSGSPSTGGTDDEPPSVADTEFTAKRECEGSTGATVEFVDGGVEAAGCIEGPNGCHVAVLEGVTTEGDTLRITVTTEEEGGTETMCTQAIVERGYEVAVSTSGGTPAAVEVVHVSMGETETVATAES